MPTPKSNATTSKLRSVRKRERVGRRERNERTTVAKKEKKKGQKDRKKRA